MSRTLKVALAQIATMPKADQDYFGQLILDCVVQFEARQTDVPDGANSTVEFAPAQGSDVNYPRGSKTDESGQ